MTEKLLQYIWQFQYFNHALLTTVDNEILQINTPGILNTNQGPDFLNANIKVGNTTWAGNIELHLKSSGWISHQHSKDKNYSNIILHVVWQDDGAAELSFPVLELQNRVSKFLLGRYDELMNTTAFIPCEKNIKQVNGLTWKSWIDRLLAERLQHKSTIIFKHLAANNNHWEETFWWLLASNFGIKVNSDAFEKIARSLPVNLLTKHKNQIHQLEALLFGQAGLLQNNFTETYPLMLQKEYRFYKSKYKLQPIQAPLFFLRMRPANFPSVRLAQLAMLINRSLHLFSVLREAETLKEIKDLLNVTANDYWHYHYVFDEATAFKEKHLGTQMINNILINTIIPIVFAYGLYNKEEGYKEKAMQWLEQTAAEKNNITNAYSLLGIQNKNAFNSQALIQLKNEYCNRKRCLECAVGNSLLKKL
ncbi:DUF2851 family protein [Ferruginibacter sp.]|uniref:DUF2851 family protein n=1 Tax=Ferruginibacter sp. TaxID=1940288 RepID=UPI0019BFFF98|nr:DUF2851 family protein [Ferruginibacter sp.]MBC7627562.1 DUF2851 family protein [Ferruginibacter sp.]